MKKIRQEKLKFYLFYSLLFIILSVFVFVPFIYQKKGFVWNQDGLRQHYSSLCYLSDYWKDQLKAIFTGQFQNLYFMDFNIGLGFDIVVTLSYYGLLEPLNLLAIFARNAKEVEVWYHILILLRFYLAGIAFSCFCFKKQKSEFQTLFGMLAYTFCGFSLYAFIRHPLFAVPFILFPLMCLGVENILEGKRSILLLVTIFLGVISNYYFFYMETIILFIYACIRIWNQRKDYEGKQIGIIFIRGVAQYIVGVLLSAAYLIPIFLGLMNNSRDGNKLGILKILFYYYPGFYIRQLQSILPVKSSSAYWTIGGFHVLALISVIVLFCAKKQYFQHKLAFILCYVGLLCPVVGYVMNGLSVPSNRWIFVLSFVIAYIIVEVYPMLFTLQKKQKQIIIAICVVFALGNIVLNHSKFYILSVLVWFAFNLILLNLDHKMLEGKEKLRDIFVLGMVCASIVIMAWSRFLVGSNYTSEFLPRGQAYQTLQQIEPIIPQEIKEDETDFYRVESSSSAYYNQATVLGYNGTNFFYSLLDKNYYNYFNVMESPEIKSAFKIAGYDLRTIESALASIKYYVNNNAKSRTKHAYLMTKNEAYCDSYQDMYESEVVLPMGYTYRNYMTKEEFEKLDIRTKEETLASTVILEEAPEGEFQHESITPLGQYLEYQISQLDGVVWNRDTDELTIEKSGAEITLAVQGNEQHETYIRLKNIEVTSEDGDMVRVKVHAGSGNTSVLLRNPNDSYFMGARSYTVNLGYQKNPITWIKIRFPDRTKMSLEDIEVFSIPVGKYKKELTKRNEDHFTITSRKNDKINGTLTTSQNKILSFSIPYSKGWSIKVDGKNVNTMKANYMYLAAEVGAGTHEVELSYMTPGLKLGGLISLLTALGLCGYGIVSLVLKRRKRME